MKNERCSAWPHHLCLQLGEARARPRLQGSRGQASRRLQMEQSELAVRFLVCKVPITA